MATCTVALSSAHPVTTRPVVPPLVCVTGSNHLKIVMTVPIVVGNNPESVTVALTGARGAISG